MPRLKKELVAEREALVKTIMTENVDATVLEINAILKEKTGMVMATTKISEIRRAMPAAEIEIKAPEPHPYAVLNDIVPQPRVAWLPISPNLKLNQGKMSIIIQASDGSQKVFNE